MVYCICICTYNRKCICMMYVDLHIHVMSLSVVHPALGLPASGLCEKWQVAGPKSGFQMNLAQLSASGGFLHLKPLPKKLLT